jgi:hypothetical protein
MTEDEKPKVEELKLKVKRIIALSLILFFTLHSAIFLWIAVVSQQRPFFEYNYIIQIPVLVIQVPLMAFTIFLAWQYLNEVKRIASIALSSITLGISSLPPIAVIISIISST